MKEKPLDEKILRKILDSIGEGDLDQIKQSLANSDLEKYRPSLREVWNQSTTTISYWLVLINDITNVKEVALCEYLLFWKEFFGKNTTRVKCFQSSEHYFFNFLLKELDINSCPIILCSDTASFANYIRINGDHLLDLNEKRKALDLFNKVHQKLMIGRSIQSIEQDLHHDRIGNFFNKEKHLKEMVRKNEIDRVLDILLKMSKVHSKKDLERELIILSNNFKSMESSIRKGIASGSELYQRRNSLIDRLLSVIDQI